MEIMICMYKPPAGAASVPAAAVVEAALLLAKSEVSEEVDRLKMHLKEVTQALEQNDPIGRRLDFLMQELNREANTLAAKATQTETTLQAVELKLLVEQMREQIQNIE